MTVTPLLDVTNLQRRFGGLQAVGGVSFTIDRGEVVSIIGPNGSGKTTTLNLITGVIRPDTGSVLLDGLELVGRRPDAVAQAGRARTFQNGRAIGNLTVRENLLVGLEATPRAGRPWPRLRRIPGVRWVSLLAETVIAVTGSRALRAQAAEDERRIDRQLERFGERLTPRSNDFAYTLSYANRRRTEIARALAAEPALLVLDEPTAGMNPVETAEVLSQLLDLKASGHTILLVEHKLDLVMSLSDRVIVLDDGVVIAEGSPEQIRNDDRVIEAYLGRPRETKAASE